MEEKQMSNTQIFLHNFKVINQTLSNLFTMVKTLAFGTPKSFAVPEYCNVQTILGKQSCENEGEAMYVFNEIMIHFINHVYKHLSNDDKILFLMYVAGDDILCKSFAFSKEFIASNAAPDVEKIMASQLKAKINGKERYFIDLLDEHIYILPPQLFKDNKERIVFVERWDDIGKNFKLATQEEIKKYFLAKGLNLDEWFKDAMLGARIRAEYHLERNNKPDNLYKYIKSLGIGSEKEISAFIRREIELKGKIFQEERQKAKNMIEHILKVQPELIESVEWANKIFEEIEKGLSNYYKRKVRQLVSCLKKSGVSDEECQDLYKQVAKKIK